LRRDVLNGFLRLRRTAQPRSNVVREMSDLSVGVIAFEGRLLKLLQLGHCLRRIKRRSWGWRWRGHRFLAGGDRYESRSADESERDCCFRVWFHGRVSRILFLGRGPRQWRSRCSLQLIEKSQGRCSVSGRPATRDICFLLLIAEGILAVCLDEFSRGKNSVTTLHLFPRSDDSRRRKGPLFAPVWAAEN